MTNHAHCLSGKARAWRRHCEQADPIRFDVLQMPPAERRRLQQYEEQLIEQLTAPDADVERRALALRALVDLRGCSTREVAQFFALESPVVVRSLMLMKVAEARQIPLAAGCLVGKAA